MEVLHEKMFFEHNPLDYAGYGLCRKRENGGKFWGEFWRLDVGSGDQRSCRPY
jgi:hypothetical protein